MMDLRLSLLVLSVLVASCGHLQDVALYDEVPAEEDPWSGFVYSEIFTDSEDTQVFGLKEVPCRSFKAVKEGSYSGKDHLHLRWDKSEGCNYVGMGFKWRDFGGKDLSGVYLEGAIELMVRVDEGFLTKVPMFFSFQDYGGKRCVSKMSILDMEGGGIGQDWTRVRIPLQAFRPERNGVNMANIKELRIEFQGQGDVHVDDIRIVPHEHHYGLSPDTSTHHVAALPMPVGCGGEFWWGINEAASHQFLLASSGAAPGAVSETVLADVKLSGEKPWDTFGFGVHEWLGVDLSAHYRTAALEFQVWGEAVPKMRLMLLAYSGEKRRIQKVIQPANCTLVGDGEWKVRVPIKSIPGYEAFGWHALKEARFKVLQEAQFKAGAFEVTEFRGNPEKPFKWKGG